MSGHPRFVAPASSSFHKIATWNCRPGIMIAAIVYCSSHYGTTPICRADGLKSSRLRVRAASESYLFHKLYILTVPTPKPAYDPSSDSDSRRRRSRGLLQLSVARNEDGLSQI